MLENVAHLKDVSHQNSKVAGAVFRPQFESKTNSSAIYLATKGFLTVPFGDLITTE